MAYSDEVLADSPIAYWRLGDSSGTTMTDSSGNSRNGTYVNTPTLGASGITGAGSNTAVTFANASNEQATYDPGANTVSGTFTVELWIKPASGTPAGYGIFGSRSPSEYGIGIQYDSYLGESIRGAVGTGTAWINTDIRMDVDLSAGTWYHVVWVITPTGYTAYLNGTQEGSGSWSSTTPLLWNSTHDFYIGNIGSTSSFSSNAWDGGIDEVAIYNTALSGTRITAHYNAGIALDKTIAGEMATATASHLTPTYVNSPNVDVTVPLTTVTATANTPTVKALTSLYGIDDGSSLTGWTNSGSPGAVVSVSGGNPGSYFELGDQDNSGYIYRSITGWDWGGAYEVHFDLMVNARKAAYIYLFGSASSTSFAIKINNSHAASIVTTNNVSTNAGESSISSLGTVSGSLGTWQSLKVLINADGTAGLWQGSTQIGSDFTITQHPGTALGFYVIWTGTAATDGAGVDNIVVYEVNATTDVTVSGAVATATANALVPTVDAGDADIAGELATATALGYAPTISTIWQRLNTFESGLATGTDITTANSDDGSAGDAFNAVSMNSANGIEFSSAQAAFGSLSMLSRQTSGGYVRWDTQGGSMDTVYVRAYYYPTSTANYNLITLRDISGGQATILRISSSGYILENEIGGNIMSLSTTISANTWQMVELKVSSSGCEIKHYNSVAATTPTTTGSTANSRSNLEVVDFGSTSASFDVYYDNIGISTTWIGPDSVDISVSGELATATAAATAPAITTTIGINISTPLITVTALGYAPTILAGLQIAATTATATASALASRIVLGYSGLVLDDGATAYFKLNESSGTTLTDFTGNGYSATLSDAYSLDQDGIPGTLGDKAIEFNASSASSTYNGPSATSDPFSVELWFYYSGQTGTLATNGRRYLYISGTNLILRSDSAATSISLSGLSGTWVHAVITMANLAGSNAGRLYRNGTQASSTISEQGHRTYAWKFGSVQGVGYSAVSTIKVDEVAFYNTELSSATITSHYDLGREGLNNSIEPPVSSASGLFVAPDVTTPNADIVAATAGASGQALTPELSGYVTVTLNVSAIATASAPTPVVGQGKSVAGEVATATALAYPITITGFVTVSATVITATGEFLYPSLTNSPNAGVFSPVMTATAQLIAPPYFDRFAMEVAAKGPAVWYRFNEAYGSTTVSDVMGYGEDGVVYNGAAFGVDGIKDSTGVRLDGINDYIMIPDPDNKIENLINGANNQSLYPLNDGYFPGVTVIMWVKPGQDYFYGAGGIHQRVLLFKGDLGSASNGTELLTIEGHGEAVGSSEMFDDPLRPGNDGNALTVTSFYDDFTALNEARYKHLFFHEAYPEWNLSDGNMHFIALTRSRTNNSNGYDPEYVGDSYTIADFQAFEVTNYGRGDDFGQAPTSASAGNPLVIGRGISTTDAGGRSRYFKGDIDELVIFDRELTWAELKAIFVAGHPNLDYPNQYTIARYPNKYKFNAMSAAANAERYRMRSGFGEKDPAGRPVTQDGPYASQVWADNPIRYHRFNDVTPPTYVGYDNASYEYDISPTLFTYYERRATDGYVYQYPSPWVATYRGQGVAYDPDGPLIDGSLSGSAKLDYNEGIDGRPADVAGMRYYELDETVQDTQSTIKDTFTFEIWFKPDFVGDMLLYRSKYNHDTVGAPDPTIIRLLSNGNISITLGGDDYNQGLRKEVAFNWQPNVWQHLVVTANFNVMKTYKNGVLINTTTEVGTRTPYISIEDFYLGADWPNFTPTFVGRLAEFALYGDVLSDAQVLEHFRLATERRVAISGVPVATASAQFVVPDIQAPDVTIYDATLTTATASANAPTVTGGSDTRVIAVLSTLTADALAPTLGFGPDIAPNALAATANAQVPTVTAELNKTVAAAVALSNAQAFAASIGAGVGIDSPALTSTALVLTPTLDKISNPSVTAALMSATGTLATPDITGSRSAEISAAVATSQMLAMYKPTIIYGNTIAGEVATATSTAHAPTIDSPNNTTITASVLASTALFNVPGITSDNHVSISLTGVVGGASATFGTPAHRHSTRPAATLITVTAATLEPTITSDWLETISATLATASASLKTPTVSVSETVAGEVVTSTALMSTPTITTISNVSQIALTGRATATHNTPTVESNDHITLEPYVMRASASAHIPIHRLDNPANVSVSGVLATASATQNVPVVTAPQTVSITATSSGATALANAPAITTDSNSEVSPTAISATARAVAPTLTTERDYDNAITADIYISDVTADIYIGSVESDIGI